MIGLTFTCPNFEKSGAHAGLVLRVKSLGSLVDLLAELDGQTCGACGMDARTFEVAVGDMPELLPPTADVARLERVEVP